MKKTSQSGFIGLIGLLVTVVIIALLFWRSDLFGAKDKNGKPVNQIQSYRQDIDAAQQAKDMMEQNSRNAAKEQN